MKLLRTPDNRFKDLPDFSFKPHYIELKPEKIRVHYVDEGPAEADPILLMHGEPSWSFLYRDMVSILKDTEYRVLAPDLVGFGRSDKPTKQTDHTYLKHVKWITQWVKKLDLKQITLFCQDWGSLIGLRVVIENQERFDRIVLSNGGLPTGEQQMNEAFLRWREFSRTSSLLDIQSIMQEGTKSHLSRKILKAYDAPFPDETYKAGPLIMPSLVPISKDDPEHEANKQAIIQFRSWKKPFLTAFSDSDPITRGGDKFFQNNVPGAKGQNHRTIKNAAHFVQEDAGLELANIIVEFIKNNP
ncbi:MAG: haloalkane dehalogenase [Promethearchaeota archaeon]